MGNSHDDLGDELEDGTAITDVGPPGTPRWVLALALVAAVFLIGAVIFMLAGGHTPRIGH